MCKKLFLSLSLVLLSLAVVQAQSLQLIANPDAGEGLQYKFIEYNGSLYFQYHNASGKYQLAKYNGTSVSLIANPDAGEGGNAPENSVVYNGNLYFQYLNASGKYQLAKYNGTSVSLIANPNNYQDLYGSLNVFNGNLYFKYGDGFSTKLAK